MTTAIVSHKGWIVIPAELRRKYGLVPGKPVAIVDYGGVLAILPAMSDPISESGGMFKGGASLTQALLAERQTERQRER